MPQIKDRSHKKTKFGQRYFVAKELQFSIALIAVLALLGGIFLQAASSALIDYWGFRTPLLGGFLILGYVILVIILAMIFSYRLIGPFKRLEYEMKLLAGGDTSRRLSIRSQDDLHIRNFVKYANVFIEKFVKMNAEYDSLNTTVSKKMEEIAVELSKEPFNCEKIQGELRTLQQQIEALQRKS
jgi:hypothetical protein